MRQIVPPSTRRWQAIYLTGLAAGVAIVAAIGSFGRGDLDTETVTSVRGEVYEVVTGGVYAHNAERVVAEGVGWDLVTLFLVVPALLLLARAVARGSLRGRLAATGLLGYLAYQYLMYAVTWAVGPLLLPFVAIYAVSLVGIGWFASTIGVAGLPDHVTGGFPRRGMTALCGAIALLLLGMWVPMVSDVLSGQLEGNLAGQTTLVVQALDLGIVVPLAIVTGVLVWRRRPLGYLLAPVLAVKGLAMAVAISAMVALAGRVEGHLEVGSLVTFLVIAAVCGVLIRAMYGSIADEAATPTDVAGERDSVALRS